MSINVSTPKAHIVDSMRFQTVINSKLAGIIESLNISYYALSRKTGIAVSTLYNIKNNKALPSAYNLFVIFDTLRISADVFFNDVFYSDIYTDGKGNPFRKLNGDAGRVTKRAFYSHSALADSENSDSIENPEYITLTAENGDTRMVSVNDLLSQYDKPNEKGRNSNAKGNKPKAD